jgi:hypothetical protein
MKATFVASLIAVPLLFIALATKRFGFNTLATLAASAVAEIVVFSSFTLYNALRASELSRGAPSAMVARAANISIGNRLSALLALCAFGLLLGLVAVAAHWAYVRAQSA